MPNPFIRGGKAVTSDPVQEHQEDMPSGVQAIYPGYKNPLDPVEERYAGSNNPYRGTEDHGVTPTEKPVHPSDWEDGKPVTYKVPRDWEDEPEPIAVRIVSEGGRELRKFRTYGAVTGVTGGPAALIVGKDEERSRVRLVHIVESAVIWVSHSRETANAREGWPLTTNNDQVFDNESELYAWADSATPLSVQVMVEYAVGT